MHNQKKQLIKKDFKQHQQDIQAGMLKHQYTEYLFHVDGVRAVFNQDTPIEQFNAFVDSITGNINCCVNQHAIGVACKTS